MQKVECSQELLGASSQELLRAGCPLRENESAMARAAWPLAQRELGA